MYRDATRNDTSWPAREYSNPMSSQFLGAVAFGFCAIGVVSFFGNMILIYAFCRTERLRRIAANVYTIHLAGNNAFLSIMSFRIGVKAFWNLTPSDLFSCQGEGFSLSVVHMNVMMTIAALFGERFIVLCRMKSRDSILSALHYHPLQSILLIWIHSGFWAFWPTTDIVPNYVEEELIPCCIFDRTTASFMNIIYIVSMSLSAFVLPLLFSCYVMHRIVTEVKRSSMSVVYYQGRRHFTHTRSVCSGTDDPLQSPEPSVRSTANANTNTGLTKVIEDSSQNASNTIARTDNLRETRNEAKIFFPEKVVLRSAIILLTTYVVSWMPFMMVCLLNIGGISLSKYFVVTAYFFSKVSCFHSSYAYATHHHYKAASRSIMCK